VNGSESAKKGSNRESRARWVRVGVKMRKRVAKNVYKKDVARQKRGEDSRWNKSIARAVINAYKSERLGCVRWKFGLWRRETAGGLGNWGWEKAKAGDPKPRKCKLLSLHLHLPSKLVEGSTPTLLMMDRRKAPALEVTQHNTTRPPRLP
jgi:hypothetical protein